MARDLGLDGALLLHLLQLVAVPDEFDTLPDREQEGDDQEGADPDGAPHLAMTLLVHFTDNRVVADVLLDRVFEGFPGHDYSARSATLSFALRARGLRSTSASVGTIGRLVSTFSPRSPACWICRSVCLPIRSSSEGRVMTAIRPPASSRRATSPTNPSRPSSSLLTQMRIA